MKVTDIPAAKLSHYTLCPLVLADALALPHPKQDNKIEQAYVFSKAIEQAYSEFAEAMSVLAKAREAKDIIETRYKSAVSELGANTVQP